MIWKIPNRIALCQKAGAFNLFYCDAQKRGLNKFLNDKKIWTTRGKWYLRFCFLFLSDVVILTSVFQFFPSVFKEVSTVQPCKVSLCRRESPSFVRFPQVARLSSFSLIILSAAFLETISDSKNISSALQSVFFWHY